jgi:hypothetical protein
MGMQGNVLIKVSPGALRAKKLDHFFGLKHYPFHTRGRHQFQIPEYRRVPMHHAAIARSLISSLIWFFNSAAGLRNTPVFHLLLIYLFIMKKPAGFLAAGGYFLTS